MGVKGLFSFINREKIESATKDFTIDEFVQEIKVYESKFNKKPKILINLRGFNNYYEQNIRDALFGGRLNAIKHDFECFLSILKNAGAELLFISKHHKNVYKSMIDYDYSKGMSFLSLISKIKNVEELIYKHEPFQRQPMNNLNIFVMAQSAIKFGEFRESDCHLKTNHYGHVKTANDEDVFAILGLNTSYLFLEGSWRFFYPMSEYDEYGQLAMIFKEFKRDEIFNYFDINIDQMQLLGLLSRPFPSNTDKKKILFDYFTNYTRTNKDFRKIINFIHKYAPREKFPLSDDTIKEMLQEIFGNDDDELMKDFEHFRYRNLVFVERNESLNDINELLRNNPYSYLTQRILNNLSYRISSHYLDTSANDMSSLKDLTLPWLKRTCGILFKNMNGEQVNPKISYQVDSHENYEDIEIEPEYPDFEIPSLMKLFKGEMSDDEKYKILAFLIDNSIDVDSLKKIPNDFIIHEIIIDHLLKV
ncbi:hypothetical protein PVAND_004543 [Polypedilum vanderplanki]|uniref:Uncharacterized protein n=1 Tax=Polypedilum vanderplanki TaxID=319348 RepID=A0A9J6BYG2_POLVA|nr:hypothetical protein PVAND_004543 [Polypedilum vanderplanki]